MLRLVMIVLAFGSIGCAHSTPAYEITHDCPGDTFMGVDVNSLPWQVQDVLSDEDMLIDTLSWDLNGFAYAIRHAHAGRLPGPEVPKRVTTHTHVQHLSPFITLTRSTANVCSLNEAGQCQTTVVETTYFWNHNKHPMKMQLSSL